MYTFFKKILLLLQLAYKLEFIIIAYKLEECCKACDINVGEVAMFFQSVVHKLNKPESFSRSKSTYF